MRILEIWRQSLLETHNKAQKLPERGKVKDGEWFRQRNWCIEGDRVKGVGSWKGNGREGKSDRKRGAARMRGRLCSR